MRTHKWSFVCLTLFRFQRGDIAEAQEASIQALLAMQAQSQRFSTKAGDCSFAEAGSESVENRGMNTNLQPEERPVVALRGSLQSSNERLDTGERDGSDVLSRGSHSFSESPRFEDDDISGGVVGADEEDF
jgi:hypothetical protein